MVQSMVWVSHSTTCLRSASIPARTARDAGFPTGRPSRTMGR
jgi:hypothetical protein